MIFNRLHIKGIKINYIIMEKYQNSKIYKLVSDKLDLVYYGSTTRTLKQRLTCHKSNYKRYLKGKTNYGTSFELLELGDARIILVEDFPCERKEDLLARERFYIESNTCVNKNIPGRTEKEWREKNKEILLEKRREYIKQNSEKLKKEFKEWANNNKEHNKEIHKKYYQDNREKISERRRRKLTCECGRVISFGSKAKHKKSLIHQELISE